MTQLDNSPSEEQVVEETKSIDSIFRVASIVLGAALVVVVFYLFLAWQLGAWQMYTLTAVIAAFATLNFMAMRMIRSGRPDTGGWMIAIGLMVVFPFAALLIASISVIFGIVLIALTVVVTTQMLPPDQARRANIIAVVTGLITATLDLFPLNYRLFVPEIQTFVPAITGVMLVVFAFFAIRQSWGNIVTYWEESIRNRLIILIVGAAVIPTLLVSIILGATTYTQVRSALLEDTFDKLTAVETIKLTQMENYIAERKGDMAALGEVMGSLLGDSLSKLETINALKHREIVRLFEDWDADVRDVASDPGVVAGIEEMSLGFQAIGAEQVRALYLGQGELENAGDESLYSTAHFEQHGFFLGYTDIHGYENAFLIDPAGNIIYNTRKGDSFGTNLLSGPYNDSNLAELYQTLLTAEAGKSYHADLALFEGEYAFFIGTPTYRGATLTGMLVYQLSVEQINEVMNNNTGLGRTGESFLVAQEADGRITFRSDRSIIGAGKFVVGYDLSDIAPPFMKDALAGISGNDLSIGGTGAAAITAYSPVNIEGLNWAILSRIDGEEILVPKHTSDEKDFLTLYAELYNYYDIFLIHPNGDIFYTIGKEADYHTNIINGEYKDTNLGTLITEVLESGETTMSDYALYEPSGGGPAAFFSAPLFDEKGDLQLLIATQVSEEDVNRFMNERSGLGDTGESYLIGQDFLGRSDSRFLEQLGVETTILVPELAVDTEASRAALAGETGQGVVIDYRGLPVLSSWAPVVIHEPDEHHPEGIHWALLTEIDEVEALGPINQLATALGIIIALTALVISVLAVFLGTRFALGFVEPILNLTNTATQVAEGNLDLRLATDSKDEIGTLTNTFNTMTAQLQETLTGLEDRVAARTKDLATVAEISTTTSTIRDPEQMLANMVHLTQRGFNLYHAHVFTYNQDIEELAIVACGYKEGDEHEGTHGTTTISMGQTQSLVALAARTRQPVIVNDVRNEPGWLPNPLLPETRAELAVPMIVGDELLGVLDVQSEHLDAFTEEDANIQMTLASQVATALQNALSYDETQKRAELESLANVIGQKIQRTGSIEETLQTAIRELGTAIGASRVRVNLKPAPADELDEAREMLISESFVAAEDNEESTQTDETLGSEENTLGVAK